jgi:hypothetical protein
MDDFSFMIGRFGVISCLGATLVAYVGFMYGIDKMKVNKELTPQVLGALMSTQSSLTPRTTRARPGGARPLAWYHNIANLSPWAI